MCSSGYVQCAVQTLLTGWIRLWWAGMSLKWLLEKKGANLMMNSSASSPCSNAGNKGHQLWWRAFSVSNAILTYLKLQNVFFSAFSFRCRKVEKILHELIHLDQCVSSRSWVPVHCSVWVGGKKKRNKTGEAGKKVRVRKRGRWQRSIWCQHLAKPVFPFLHVILRSCHPMLSRYRISGFTQVTCTAALWRSERDSGCLLDGHGCLQP